VRNGALLELGAQRASDTGPLTAHSRWVLPGPQSEGWGDG